ncbi:MAG: DJ-1 family protein [Deltaproteobacteria bacterium]|nr:MAG: DJ-1 family protein [Deltaproteobacteria bacterium]
MAPRILVPMANGTEMIEALTIVDVFRRAGIIVDTASVNNLVITSSHGVRIEADKLIGECLETDYDLVALPGGIPGAENLRKSEELTEILKNQAASGRFYGAICASPAVILADIGLLEDKQAVCHPMFASGLGEGRFYDKKVVVDGNCITSRGAGTSMDFALELLTLVAGKEKMLEVAKGLVV